LEVLKLRINILATKNSVFPSRESQIHENVSLYFPKFRTQTSSRIQDPINKKTSPNPSELKKMFPPQLS